MKLKEQCGICNSWSWCGRPCKHAPKDAVADGIVRGLLLEKDEAAKVRQRHQYQHNCAWCGSTFYGSAHAQYCTDRCRVKAWRVQQGGVGREGIGPNLRFKVFERDGFKCLYCGKNANDGAVLEVDHFLPVARGGGNEIGNLVTACKECNAGKAASIVTTTTIEELRLPAVGKPQ